MRRTPRRRKQLIAAGAAVVASLVPSVTAGTSFAADETAAAAANADPVSVQGTVFKDVNRNGVRDGGEAPMSGVDVTDGAVWTTTGADGSYILRMDPSRRETDLVSVVSPNGYTPALRKDYVRSSSTRCLTATVRITASTSPWCRTRTPPTPPRSG